MTQPRARFGVSSGVVLFGVAALALPSACSSDNGDNTHGPTFGDLPTNDDPNDAASDGGRLPDGAPRPKDAGEGTGSCGTVAVLAGDDTSLGAAIQERGGAWSVASITGGAAKSKPAVVAFGTGFLGVTHGKDDALQTTTFGTSWSAATGFGAANVKGPPTLAVAGTKAHVVYPAGPGQNRDFFHGIHDGAGWNAATDAVGPPPSFGTLSAALAAVGTDVVFAENGSDNAGLYVRTFGGSWSAPAGVPGAGTVSASLPATPELVAVQGKFDLLLVYVQEVTRRLSFATREAAPTHTWVGGNVIHPDATTAEKLSLARTSESTVVVAFRGQDGKGYYSQGTIGAEQVTWTAGQAVGGGTAPDVDSAPAVARGVCGDDVVIAYSSGGILRTTRLRGADWTTPEPISGITGSRVAIATR